MLARRQSRIACLLLLCALAGCAGAHGGGSSVATSLECAPYARQVTGLQLYGDAASWWDGAAGRYPRSAVPAPGAVLVFRRSGRLPSGHVSVVTEVTAPGEVVVTQANWVHGRIARSEPIVDVSPGHDWTAVRVWWEPAGQLGITTYPTFGFIGPANAAPATEDVVAANALHPWPPQAGVAQ